MTPKRVGLFIASMNAGGAERAVQVLANGLQARDIGVDLVLASAVGPRLADLAPGVNVIDLQAGRTAMAIPKLAAYLLKRRPDVLISHMHHCNIAAGIARLIVRGRMPLLAVHHTHLSASRRERQRLRHYLVRSVAGAVVSRMDEMIGVSQGVAEDIRKAWPDLKVPVSVLYNPIDVEMVRQKAQQAPLIAIPRVPGKPLIVALGRLVEAKDYPTLVMAFRELCKHRPSTLAILGEGEERPKIEALIKDLALGEDLHLLGHVDNPYPFLAAADAFVLSSKREGLPTALIEAMVLGVPIVATDCPTGPREILEGGKWGALVPVGDHHAIARALGDCVNSAAREIHRRVEDFAADRCVDAYLATVETHLSQRSRHLAS